MFNDKGYRQGTVHTLVTTLGHNTAWLLKDYHVGPSRILRRGNGLSTWSNPFSLGGRLLNPPFSLEVQALGRDPRRHGLQPCSEGGLEMSSSRCDRRAGPSCSPGATPSRTRRKSITFKVSSKCSAARCRGSLWIFGRPCHQGQDVRERGSGHDPHRVYHRSVYRGEDYDAEVSDARGAQALL